MRIARNLLILLQSLLAALAMGPPIVSRGWFSAVANPSLIQRSRSGLQVQASRRN
jgi:hypothetical protein